jgi:hypothetical protein
MVKPAKTKRKWGWRTIVLLACASLAIIAVLLVFAHRLIEDQLFRYLTSQQDMQVKIGSRNGNLLSGYTLGDVSIRHPGGGNTPASTFSTPKLTIHWHFEKPPLLTAISWDSGTYTLESKGQADQEIPIGPGTMVPSVDPTKKGWLENANAVTIGPDSWLGKATLRVRRDGQQFEGNIHVEHLPSTYLTLAGSVPQGFVPLGDLILDMDLTGDARGVQAHGSVTDPLTREAFRF